MLNFFLNEKYFVFSLIHNRLAKAGNDLEYVRFTLCRPHFEKISGPTPKRRDDESEISDVEVTQSKELAKESNFVDLPDNSQIVTGGSNIANFGEDPEYMAPFACIMAAVIGKKYNVLTWSKDVIDYALKCGSELYNKSTVRFDQVPKLEIPKISLGKTDYSIEVNYLYDAKMKQQTVETVLNRILFQNCDWGILVTTSYACAIFYHNYLYYLFECFGCNEVGLGEGPSETGMACLSRFKDLHSMATRIMYNKSRRETVDQLDYTRFVLSVCKVKYIPPEVEIKKRGKKTKSEGFEDLMQQEGEIEEEVKTKSRKDEERPEPEPKNLVGCVF